MAEIKRASGVASCFNWSLMDDNDTELLANCLFLPSNESIVSDDIDVKRADIPTGTNNIYFTDIIGKGWGGKIVKSKLSEDILKMYENNMMIPSDVLEIAFKMRAFVIVKPQRTSAQSNYYLKAYKNNKSYQEIKNIIEINTANRFRENTTLWLLKYD